MDSFSIIKDFFTRMTCNICEHHFKADGIELLQEDSDMYVVSVFCHHCDQQIGVALVGVETAPNGVKKYRDPEFTDWDLERLAEYSPISEDDVLDAHYFFQNLDNNWSQLIPEEILERYTDSQTESQAAETLAAPLPPGPQSTES